MREVTETGDDSIFGAWTVQLTPVMNINNLRSVNHLMTRSCNRTKFGTPALLIQRCLFLLSYSHVIHVFWTCPMLAMSFIHQCYPCLLYTNVIHVFYTPMLFMSFIHQCYSCLSITNVRCLLQFFDDYVV